MEFGNILSDLRNKAKITQQELANVLGISRGTIGMYEIGKRDPDTETLKKIAQYFNVSIDYLLGNSNNRNIDESKIPERDKKLMDDISSLDDDLKKEAEKYIELLKIKQNLDKNKDEQSATLDQGVC
jgi:transcriptional regulator with XRE-family HTH domain